MLKPIIFKSEIKNYGQGISLYASLKIVKTKFMKGWHMFMSLIRVMLANLLR